MTKPIHPKIKERLGYPEDQPDKEVLSDWKQRTRRVCKPCWELKYCPYGPLVEQSPLLPIPKETATEHNNYLKECLKNNTVGSVVPLEPAKREIYTSALKDKKLLELLAWRNLQHELFREDINKSGLSFQDYISQPLPPIHQYRGDFENNLIPEIPDKLDPDIRRRLNAEMSSQRKHIRNVLKTDQEDNRSPLDPARREWFEKQVNEFNPDDHPDVPQVFKDAECSVFGHICPVVFAAEAFTESTSERRMGRYISFNTKMRVVRRDNYTCQHCTKHLLDNEVEFDHIIPISKGGSSEEHNIRLTCFDCNRDKSDNVKI